MPKLKQTKTLLLASESPRRIEILKTAGINFKVKVSPYDEPPANFAPEELARVYALGKVIALLKLPNADKDCIYIGVDTIVVCDGQILQKPKDAMDARRMLLMQQGNVATVISGVAVVDPQTGQEEVFAEKTIVRMSPMTEAETDWYISTNEWQGKSGGFAIQGLASRFFTGIEGDILNVIGLPLNRLYETLKDWKVFTC